MVGGWYGLAGTLVHNFIANISLITGIFSKSTFVDNPGPGDLFGGNETGFHSAIDTRSRVFHTHGKSLRYAFLQKGERLPFFWEITKFP